MKVIDIILALICGKVIGLVIGDFLTAIGISIGFYYFLILWILFPLIALVFLWIAYAIGQKLLFIFQVAKHLLVGAFATVVDLKLFELMVFLFGLALNPFLVKSISFIFSTVIKYWGNKYWAFEQHQKEDAKKEFFQFVLITLIGLMIDVGFFYYFTKMGAQFGLSAVLWTKASVLTAGAVAAIWNFMGYKFLVFKK